MRDCDAEDHIEDYDSSADMEENNRARRRGPRQQPSLPGKGDLATYATRPQKVQASLAHAISPIMHQNSEAQRPSQEDNDRVSSGYGRRKDNTCNTINRDFPEEQPDAGQPDQVRSPQTPANPDSEKEKEKEAPVDGKAHGEQIAIPLCTSKEDKEALLNAQYPPPVTRASLRELDLGLIQANINLRVDLNYDHDLHFTPVSGLKGEKKKSKALLYWQSLVAEFRITYHNNSLQICTECKARSGSGGDPDTPHKFYPRLPDLFHNLKDLLTILVPDRDQDQISQFLDIPLLTQEAAHGVLDVVGLGRWLCDLLTTHCAPMRDVYAQEMADKIREGAEEGSMAALVDGIKKLFDFLEAMKLDVANHQIRSFRYHLIEDTVPFQKDHFRVRIHNKRFDVEEPRQWFLETVESHKNCQGDAKLPTETPLDAMLHGLAELCVNTDLAFPETLKHDVSRLGAMRDQIQDIIHIDICLSVFDDQIKRLVGSRFNPSSLHPILETRIKDLQNLILDLTDGHMNPDETMAQMWSQHCSEIAQELHNAASSVCKRVGCILPDSEIDTTGKQLWLSFAKERSDHIRAKLLQEALEGGAQRHARLFDKMTTLDISEKQKRHHLLRLGDQDENQQWRQMPTVDDMARKLAHVAVIHMRVWADLVYFPAEAEEDIAVD